MTMDQLFEWRSSIRSIQIEKKQNKQVKKNKEKKR